MNTNIVKLINSIGKIDMTRRVSRTESKYADDRRSHPLNGWEQPSREYEGLLFAVPYRDSEGVSERGFRETALYVPAGVEVDL